MRWEDDLLPIHVSAIWLGVNISQEKLNGMMSSNADVNLGRSPETGWKKRIYSTEFM